MAVPKKKTARSRSKVRYQAYVQKQQKKMFDFIEKAKRNERGAKKAKTVSSSQEVTKIEA